MPTLSEWNNDLRKAIDCLDLITPIDEDFPSPPQVQRYTRAVVVDWHNPYDESEFVNRASALAFLGKWARRFASLGPVDKKYGTWDVEVSVSLFNGWKLCATASTAMVCTFEPVLGDDGEPLTELVDKPTTSTFTVKERVPVTKKVCPPSFLAGVKV